MKIAVTGLGVVSCCGNSVDSFWNSIINGNSGLSTTDRFNDAFLKTKLVGKVKNFSLDSKYNIRIRTKTDSHIQYALDAADQAITQAGLPFTNPYRIHTIIGTCSGSYNFLQSAFVNPPVQPYFLTGNLNNMVASYINMHYGILGSGIALNGACASGSQAIAFGAMLIETGQADAVIVGGTEDWIHPVPIGALEALKALTYDREGCKPFDVNRSGFSLSEGAAVVILESENHAKKRNADILAYLAGYGLSNDANHPTSPREDGIVTKFMISQALNKAEISSIDYINAHATGTKIGDKIESEVMYSLFGNVPYISSTKPITGHAIGAVGAMEAIISVKALQEQIIPHTKNLMYPDCPGNHVLSQSINTKVQNVLSSNFGFGGTNSVLIFSKA